MQKEKPSPERKFPPFYEKAIPIALWILAAIIVGMFVFSTGVALGWITF